MGFLSRLFGHKNNGSASSYSRYNRYDEANARYHLEKVIMEEWFDYELRQNIPASALDAEPGALDYDYGLYLNGEPKLMIVLIHDSNGWKRLSTRKAQNACLAKGVGYMNVMTYFPNHEDYLSARLRERMNA